MEKHKVASRLKFIMFLLLLVSGAGFLSVFALRSAFRANPVWATPLPVPAPLPATDIVYQGASQLGFINADGSDAITVQFFIPQKTFLSGWAQPFIVGDPQVLVVTNGVMRPGNIYVARPGQIALDCGWLGMTGPATDGRHILVITSEGTEEYLPEDCGTGNPPEKVYSGVFGVLSPDEQYLADVKAANAEHTTYLLIIRTLTTGEERIIGDGAYPVWSYNGQWLAYTGPDGIYIVQNEPNAEPRRLVTLDFPYRESGWKLYTVEAGGSYYPPTASWSPDGKWLVYHQYYVDSRAKFPEQYSIFKINIETGKTTKLVDGGLFPQWRWPVDEP